MDESFIGTITRDGRRTGQFYAGAVEFDQSSFCGHSGSNKSPRPPKTLPSKASYLPPRRRINPLRLPLDPIPTAKRPNRLRNDRLIITNALISTIRAACGRGFSIEELFFPSWVEINHEVLICRRFPQLSRSSGVEEEDRGSKVFSFVGKWTVRMTNDRRIVCRNLINTELEVEIETYTLGF